MDRRETGEEGRGCCTRYKRAGAVEQRGMRVLDVLEAKAGNGCQRQVISSEVGRCVKGRQVTGKGDIIVFCKLLRSGRRKDATCRDLSRHRNLPIGTLKSRSRRVPRREPSGNADVPT